MITLTGGHGFVGAEIAKQLTLQGMEYQIPDRNESFKGRELGDIIYCIGLTADFRSRPFDTIDAHINVMKEMLMSSSFDSFTYLSSARIYVHNKAAVDEDSPIEIQVNDPFDLFNLSKLTGESLLLNTGKNVRIVRLSNVFGNDFASENFLTSIVRDAVVNKEIVLRTTPDSAKDYIDVESAAKVIIRIALEGRSTIYNVASGTNTTNQAIVGEIQRLTGCAISYIAKPEHIVFPAINVEKIKKEFQFKPKISAVGALDRIIKSFAQTTSPQP